MSKKFDCFKITQKTTNLDCSISVLMKIWSKIYLSIKFQDINLVAKSQLYQKRFYFNSSLFIVVIFPSGSGKTYLTPIYVHRFSQISCRSGGFHLWKMSSFINTPNTKNPSACLTWTMLWTFYTCEEGWPTRRENSIQIIAKQDRQMFNWHNRNAASKLKGKAVMGWATETELEKGQWGAPTDRPDRSLKHKAQSPEPKSKAVARLAEQITPQKIK